MGVKWAQPGHGGRRTVGFTLIELLVVTAIVALLISILIPSLSAARSQAKAAICLSQLRTLGRGLHLYANEHSDVIVPGRLPSLNDDHWRMRINGGQKYRPTFLAIMAHQVGLRPFEQPLANRRLVDAQGQPGDRQNYSDPAYYCPETPDWRDERNGSYSFNYQFLGNARLLDPDQPYSFKNWTVRTSEVRTPASCVAMGDGMGTAASFARLDRQPYEENDAQHSQLGRNLRAYGNEGFNLDPPRIDPEHGEAAGIDGSEVHRTAPHERHRGKAVIQWVDGHATAETLKSLGYEAAADGVVGLEGRNRFFHIKGLDEAWVEPRRR